MKNDFTVAQSAATMMCKDGIDDWAWKTQHRYGTITLDLERNVVIDVVETRNREAIVSWFRSHPTIGCYRESSCLAAKMPTEGTLVRYRARYLLNP